MTINFDIEDARPLAQIAKRLGKHPDTLLSWILKGKYGVRLEAVTLPGGYHTSILAVERFAAALGAVAEGRRAPEGPAVRNRLHEEATKRLNAAGW